MLSIKRDGLIGLTAHRTDEVEHRGRRDRVLDGGVAGNCLQTVIGFQERMILGETNAVFDHHRFSLGLEAFKMHRPVLGLDMMQTGKTGEKVQMPEGAAEFAVGHSLEAVLHFLFNEILDEAVFERGERGTIELPGLKSVTRVEQFLGAQKAADNISTIRGIDLGHFSSPALGWRTQQSTLLRGMGRTSCCIW